MCRSILADHLVGRRVHAVGLNALLQIALGIGRVLGALIGQMGLERARDEGLGDIPTAVQIQGADQGLVDVLESGVHAASTSPLLGGAQDDDLVDPQLESDFGKRGARDERYLETGELALVERPVGLEERERDDRTENRVAQELKALVRGRDGLPLNSRGVRDGAAKQLYVSELVTADLLRERELIRDGQNLLPQGLSDGVDGLSHGVDGHQFVVVDLDVELILHSGDELQAIEGIRIEVIEGGRLGQLVRLNAEDIGRDIAHLGENIITIECHE